MDLFDIPDDYVPEKPLTDQEMDDITNYLKNHPLFLKELPQNYQDNEILVALQSLKEEEDLNHTAQNLCILGSDFMKKNANNKHYLKSAYQKYTQAINFGPTDPQLLAKLHCNRALINLKNKNFGKVIIDCRIAIRAKKDYTKAYYRCAQAYIAVKRFKQAIYLLKDRKQPELDQLRNQALKHLQKQKNIEEEKQKKQQTKLNEVADYCANKKYNVLKRLQPLPENAKIQFVDGKLSIPILFAYPQFSQMDLIAHTKQEEKIRTYLSQLFESPLPWDHKNQYNSQTCELFCQLSEQKVIKIPKQAKIQEIAKRVPMKGALQIIIISKNSAFYQIYLKGKQIF